MKKFMVLLLFFLAITLSMLLKWQWHAFSSSISEEKQTEADQKIQIVSGAKSLNIKQTFTGIGSEKEFELIVPNLVTNWVCETESGEPCPSNDQIPHTFQPVDGVIQIKYSVPLDRKKAYSLLSNWKIHLRDVHIQYSTVSIAESFHRNGTWIAGLPLKGQNQLDLIDFFSFAGEGDFTSLYFQTVAFKYQKQESNLSLYTDNNTQFQFPLYSELPEKKFIALVSTENLSTSSSDMIFFNQKKAQNTIEKSLITHYFQQKIDGNIGWLVELLASNHMKESPKNAKAIDVNNELTKGLTSEEYNELKQLISNSKVILNSQKLDELLSGIKGLETKFFQKNISAEKISALHFFESRIITVNNETPTNIEVILKEGKRLYPLSKLVTKIGYHVDNEPNQLSFNKGEHSYHFYPNQNLFSHNEQDYGLLENPLILIDNEYYMEQKWLQTIFKLTMEDVEGRLNINEDLR
jgi:hypothetical protein